MIIVRIFKHYLLYLSILINSIYPIIHVYYFFKLIIFNIDIAIIVVIRIVITTESRWQMSSQL